ncbi:MAG: hypothetical protein ACP5FL_08950, partial [Thermoplasmatota archaeon]
TLSYVAGGDDVWLIKTDTLGNEESNSTYGGTSSDVGYSVQQTTDGGYIVAGHTLSYGAGVHDAWLIKIANNGSEICIDMVFSPGWNIVTFPVEHNYTAKGLLASVENCTVVYSYDAANATPRIVTASSPPENDFPLRDGVGYFVAVSSNSTFNVTGVPITNVSIHLYPGWNMLGWYHDYSTTAKSILQNITDCSVVYWYDAENALAKIVTASSPPENDFPVTQGMGLFVAVTLASDWHGEG